MLSTDQITQQIINQLRLLDPTASAEIGTPERKIIESVAEMIAESQVDFSVLDSQHDLDSMSGGRLDSFLGNFGFARQQAVAATGTVTFSRSTSASADIVIPAGTQVQAQTDNPAFANVLFALTETVTLALGDVSVDATVQATTPGTIGNVAANTISSFAGVASVSGINSISNADATSGGEDAETDEELKVRFKNTIFRNMVGTYDNYMSLSVALPNVTKANVIGAVSRYQEYVAVPGTNDTAQATCLDDGTHNGSTTGYDPVVGNLIWPHKRTTAVSTNPYSQYVYDQNAYITNGNLGPDATFYRRDVDYVFNRIPRTATSGSFHTINSGANALHQPNVTFLKTSPTDATANPDIVGDGNTTLLMEYAYISSSSRNNISLGITNAVDVFINGEDIQNATSQEVMPGAENKLHSAAPTTNWSYQDVANPNYRRKLDSVACAVGNVLVPLYFEPVTDVPDSITMKNQTDSKPYTFYKANFKQSNVYYFDDPTAPGTPRRASYLMIEEVNGYYGTTRARNGIEWLSIQPNGSTKSNGYAANSNGTLVLQDSNTKANPLDTGFIGQQFKCKYTWDRNVGSAQTIMDANKQITADVLVHRARKRYFQVNVTIMYSIGANKSAINAGILATLDAFYSTQFYGAAIQLSDILQAVHNVPGVDNVRWTNDDPVTGVKVEEVQANGDFFASRSPHQYKKDFFIGDDTLASVPTPLATAAKIVVRAANTWST